MIGTKGLKFGEHDLIISVFEDGRVLATFDRIGSIITTVGTVDDLKALRGEINRVLDESSERGFC